MSDRIALVTGASRGLGAALAEALAPDHHVVAVARTTGALEELDDRIRARGGAATLAPMDVANGEAMGQLCMGMAERWGRVDLWVHTAIHAAPLTPVSHIQDGDWSKSVEINLQSTRRLIGLVEPLLMPSNGSALFFDDPRAGEKFFGIYGATKAAQMALARSWQSETRNTGPRVVIATPDPMPTAVRARFFPGEDRATLARPEDVAARILADL